MRRLFGGVFLLFGTIACFPYRGLGQIPISKAPIRFIDSQSGLEIDEVLALPCYCSFAGVSTMLGEGPGSGSNKSYLASPFLYRRGELFAPRQPKSGGIMWGPGWMFTGKGISVDGVALLAPGYALGWFEALFDESERSKPISLVRIPSDMSATNFAKLSRLLHQQELARADVSQLKTCKPDVEIRFNKAEYALVDEFLLRGLKE